MGFILGFTRTKWINEPSIKANLSHFYQKDIQIQVNTQYYLKHNTTQGLGNFQKIHMLLSSLDNIKAKLILPTY